MKALLLVSISEAGNNRCLRDPSALHYTEKGTRQSSRHWQSRSQQSSLLCDDSLSSVAGADGRLRPITGVRGIVRLSCGSCETGRARYRNSELFVPLQSYYLRGPSGARLVMYRTEADVTSCLQRLRRDCHSRSDAGLVDNVERQGVPLVYDLDIHPTE